MGEAGNIEQVVRKFFRDLGAAAGMHPSVADQVADHIVGPEVAENGTEDKGSE